jgi:hypothetical protein
MVADLDAARRWMEEELRGGDPQRQKRVLGMMPELGDAYGRPMASLLAKLIGDSNRGIGVRARAVLALAGIRHTPDRETWQILEAARKGERTLFRDAATWAWCELGRCADLGLVKVPAGEFLIGEQKEQHTLYLPTFYIGRGPVTVAAFRELLAESGIRISDKEEFDRWNKNEDYPVVKVSWHDALAYAEWHGFGLPSEAEWEKAARGTDGWEYPWGNDWQSERANTAEHWQDGGRKTTPVGRFSPQGDSPYGCVDMVGNVWEWTRSIYEPYPYDPEDGRERRDSPGLRVVRGGAFGNSSRFVRCASRDWLNPDFRDDYLGFRVVLSPFPL